MRPTRSDSFPYSGWNAVWVSMYVTETQVYSACWALNSLVIVGSAVDTIV